MNKETKCRILSIYLTENVDTERLISCYYNTKLNYYKQLSEVYLDDILRDIKDIEIIQYNDEMIEDYIKYENKEV